MTYILERQSCFGQDAKQLVDNKTAEFGKWCQLSTFFILCLNYMIFPFVLPPPHLRQCFALFAVAEGWLLLDIEWFVLFFYTYYQFPALSPQLLCLKVECLYTCINVISFYNNLLLYIRELYHVCASVKILHISITIKYYRNILTKSSICIGVANYFSFCSFSPSYLKKRYFRTTTYFKFTYIYISGRTD